MYPRSVDALRAAVAHKATGVRVRAGRPRNPHVSVHPCPSQGSTSEGIRVRFSWKRWRLAPVAALAALAMSLVLAAPAFAAEPGEWGSWGTENANGGQIYVRGTVSEARNANGNLLVDVWRGDTNNYVWISINNGSPFTLQNPDGSEPETGFSPVVVPYGADQFMIFHTGMDGNIYYAWIDPYANDWAQSWTAIPDQSTDMAVSAAQIGNQSDDLYLVYHSSAGDDYIWGTYFDGHTWGDTQIISGGRSYSAPSVTYNNNHLYAFARGETDNQVWMAQSYDIYGQSWGGWTGQGGNTYVSPEVTTNLNTGEMVVDYVDENSYRPTWRTYDSNGNPTGGWSLDTTGYQTVNPVALSWVAGAIFAILTGLSNEVWYKQVTSS
jgi:hypothetical protein